LRELRLLKDRLKRGGRNAQDTTDLLSHVERIDAMLADKPDGGAQPYNQQQPHQQQPPQGMSGVPPGMQQQQQQQPWGAPNGPYGQMPIQQPWGGMPVQQPPWAGGYSYPPPGSMYGGAPPGMPPWMSMGAPGMAAHPQMDYQQQAALRDIEEQARQLEAENNRIEEELKGIHRNGGAHGGGAGESSRSPRKGEANHKEVVELEKLEEVHNLEMARLQYEKEKLESEAQLETLREKLDLERETRHQSHQHALWVEEQKRNIQALRVKKAYAREIPMADTNWSTATLYDADSGLKLFLDFAVGLPKKVRTAPKGFSDARLVYALYSDLSRPKARSVSALAATPWSETDRKGASQTGELGSTVTFACSHVFGGPDSVSSESGALAPAGRQPDAQILIELQGKPVEAAPRGKQMGVPKGGGAKPVSLGWAVVDLRTSAATGPTPGSWYLSTGNFKTTLIPGPYMSGTNYATSVKSLGQSSKFAVYLRVASVAREPPQIPIDPFLTHHLYRVPEPKEAAQQLMGARGSARSNGGEADGGPNPNTSISVMTTVEKARSKFKKQRSTLSTIPSDTSLLRSPDLPPLILHFHVLEGSESMNKLLDTTDVMTLAVGVRFTVLPAGDDGAAEAPESTAADADLWVTQTATRMEEGHWAWDGQQLEIPPMATSVKLRVLLVPKDPAVAGASGGAVSPTPSDRSGGKLRRAGSRSGKRGNALSGSSSNNSLNPNQPRELATAELSLLPPPVGDNQRIEIKASAGSGLAYAQAGPPAGVLVVDIEEAPVHEEGDDAHSDFDEHVDDHGSTMESLDSMVEDEKNSSVMSGKNLWLEVDNAALVRKQGLPRKSFNDGDGIDIYIDGARQLPANVSVTKVSVKILSSDGPGEEATGVAQLTTGSNLMSPVYKCRLELRQDTFDPRSMLLLRIDTMARGVATTDESPHGLHCVGYSLFNLFVDPDDPTGGGMGQPSTSNVPEFSLNAGAFQIPLCRRPPTGAIMKSLDAKGLEPMPRVPCATVLLRVVPAPKSRDGLTTLSREDYPEAEWAKRGLEPPPPDQGYYSEVYDSTRCKPNGLERKLYMARSKRSSAHLEHAVTDEATRRMLEADPDRRRSDLDDATVLKWEEVKLAGKPRSMLDYTLCHPYQPEQGLLVSVDSLLHLPKPPSKGAFSSRAPQPFYKAVYFMTPPGFYMQTPPLTSDTQFTIATDVKAPQKHQRFLDGLIPFRNVPYDRNAMLVLEIREINVNTKPAKGPPHIVEPASKGMWTVVPVFRHEEIDDGADWPTVASGVYGLPLFKGAVPKELVQLAVVGDSDPWNWIEDRLFRGKDERKMKPGEIALAGDDKMATAVIRLVDAQLDPDAHRFDSPLRDEIMVEGSDTNLHGHVPKLNVDYAERMWRNAAPKNAGGPGEAEINRIIVAPDNTKKKDALEDLVPNPNAGDVEGFLKAQNEAFASATKIQHYRF